MSDLKKELSLLAGISTDLVSVCVCVSVCVWGGGSDEWSGASDNTFVMKGRKAMTGRCPWLHNLKTHS